MHPTYTSRASLRGVQQVGEEWASPPVWHDVRCAAGSTSDAANALAQETASIRVQRRSSSLHRPPVSIAITTNLHRPDVAISGCVLSLSWRATVSCTRMGLSFSSQHSSECDIHCQLHTSITRKILCQHFNSSGVLRRHIHVHVLQECIHPDRCSCFSEDARHDALDGDCAFLDAATAHASCAVLAPGIQGSVTPFTPILCDLEWQTQPLQEQCPEQMWWDRALKCGGTRPELLLHSALSVTASGPGEQRWSWPTLAKPTLASVSVLVVWPTLAKTDFGQNRLWPNRV